jgi:5-methylcytosine-specific restriction enzyme A
MDNSIERKPPMQPNKPCCYPGCTSYAIRTKASSSRCEKHQPKAWADKTESSHARGYGHKWQKLRASILVRDDYLCQICKERSATEVDHIVSKALGGSNSDDNLQAVCGYCHKKKTASERNKTARKGV